MSINYSCILWICGIAKQAEIPKLKFVCQLDQDGVIPMLFLLMYSAHVMSVLLIVPINELDL